MSVPSLTPGTWLLLSLLAAQVPPMQGTSVTPAQTSVAPAQDAANATKEIEQLLADSAAAYDKNETHRGRELAEAARVLATRHALPALEAECLFRLGKHERWYDRNAAAVGYYERSRALFLQVGNRGRAAGIEAYMGTAWSALGEHARAYEMLQSARKTLREVGDVEGLALAGEGLMFAMEESPEKERLRAEVLVDVRASRYKSTECNIGQEWGDGLFNLGRYAEAYAVLTEAVRCFEQTDDLARTGRALVSLGRVERVHGQLDKALDNYTRALALQNDANDDPAAVQSMNAISVTLGMLGRHEEAIGRLEEAIARARRNVPGRVNTLSGNLGGLYLEMGEYQRAAQLLVDSRAHEQQPVNFAWRTRQLAWAYFKLGRPAEALALANESVDLVQAMGPEMRLRALFTRVSILRELGRLDEARRDLAAGMRIADDLRKNTLPEDIMRRGFGETLRIMNDISIDVLIAAKDGRAALASSEQARSRAFLDRLASRDAARATSTAAAPTAATPTPSRSTGATSISATPATASTPDAPAPAATDGVAPTSAPTPSAPTAAPASVEDIQALAARFRSTWVMFWVGPTATTVWVVQPSGAVHWRRLPIPAAQLETLVAQSVPRGSGLDGLAAMSFASRAHLRPWRELYRRLLLPVSAYLPTTPGARLTIVPHGPLFRLSFAALQDEQGRYLLERYELHYVPAAGVLQFTAAAQRHALTRADSALLVGDPLAAGGSLTSPDTLSTGMRGMIVRGGAGDPAPPHQATAAQSTAQASTRSTTSVASGPSGPSSTPSSLPALGWARREVLSILKLLPSESIALVGADATETAVRERMVGRRVIHFATHGVVFNNDAAVSSSYLAVSRERTGTGTGNGTVPSATPDANADGRLTADEIDHLTLDADLVVLSACGTALGPISGDGVQGFTRAFLSAGADSVIATTWSVADRTSYQVMERFYRGWLSGQSKARALRQAQLGLLRQLRAGGLTIDGVVLHDSPWLWAGFVLVGNP